MVADHLRAMTFLIADGVLPGNEGRGYVLRKIMRRALRHGRKLGIEGAFLSGLTAAVVERMKAAYPELVSHQESVGARRAVEEERFRTTLKQAFAVFEEIAGKAEDRPERARRPTCSGSTTPTGCPLDFTEELAKDRGLGVDLAGFERELPRSRSARGSRARWAPSRAIRST